MFVLLFLKHLSPSLSPLDGVDYKHLQCVALRSILLLMGDKAKDSAAVALGRKGGTARAKKLSAKQRSESARKASKARWGKKRKENA
jgi:hypothetical protein